MCKTGDSNISTDSHLYYIRRRDAVFGNMAINRQDIHPSPYGLRHRFTERRVHCPVGFHIAYALYLNDKDG